jgi:SAM-dependent methyltransferase
MTDPAGPTPPSDRPTATGHRRVPPEGASVIRLSPHTEQFHEMREWIQTAYPGRISVLDVGGGGGFYDFPAGLRAQARRIVGVDPDPGILHRPWLDESHQMLVEEYAPLGDERFDVALCMYVAEHVEAPGPFLEAIRSRLQPWGSCFGVTPNLWHYFGLVSATTARIGVEDWLLRQVRPAELIEAYHSPVRYRLNSVRRIRDTALAAGFRSAEFRVLEQAGMFETYFPPSIRWAPRAYSRMINGLGYPELFGTLLFRLGA